jgi:hypothetical protein
MDDQQTPSIHSVDKLPSVSMPPSRFGGAQPARRPDDKRKRLGPHSRVIDRGAVGLAIDPHSREGRFIRAYERLLIEHIGGEASASMAQRLMITRAARIALHLELLDESVFKAGHALTLHDFTHYCAWSNCLGRLLKTLGLEAPSAGQILDPIARINDYLASHRDEERNAR